MLRRFSARLALSLLSGILLVCIHPRLNLTLLAPLATAPFFLALAHEPSAARRFLCGYLAGFAFWAGINYWIQFVMSVHGGLGEVGGAAVFLLFCAIKALHLGFFGLFAGLLTSSWYAAPALAALWVAIERIPGPFGYTWLTLGNAGIDMGVPMRLAPFTGVYGLSFVFALLGACVALALLGRPRRHLLWAAAALLLVLLPGLPSAEAGAHSAVALQPNLPEEKQWTEPEVGPMQQRLEYLTLRSALATELPRADLILWPEAPAPLYYYDDPPLRDRVTNMARLARAHVLMGTVARSQGGAPLNAALLLRPDGAVEGRYDKMFLVPFGEYVPFPFGSFAQSITREIGDFVPGERVMVFPAPGGRLGAFICYESAFPHLVREFAAAGSTVLANLSNDGYFGKSAAREQHLSLVRMRGAENRRWILRATNDGITAAIDPAGRVFERFPSFEQTAGRLRYSHVVTTTAYTRLGDLFAWLCAGASVILLLTRFWRIQ